MTGFTKFPLDCSIYIFKNKQEYKLIEVYSYELIYITYHFFSKWLQIGLSRVIHVFNQKPRDHIWTLGPRGIDSQDRAIPEISVFDRPHRSRDKSVYNSLHTRLLDVGYEFF